MRKIIMLLQFTVGLVNSPEIAEAMKGDILEMFERKKASRNGWVASAWFMRQLLSCLSVLPARMFSSAMARWASFLEGLRSWWLFWWYVTCCELFIWMLFPKRKSVRQASAISRVPWHEWPGMFVIDDKHASSPQLTDWMKAIGLGTGRRHYPTWLVLHQIVALVSWLVPTIVSVGLMVFSWVAEKQLTPAVGEKVLGAADRQHDIEAWFRGIEGSLRSFDHVVLLIGGIALLTFFDLVVLFGYRMYYSEKTFVKRSSSLFGLAVPALRAGFIQGVSITGMLMIVLRRCFGAASGSLAGWEVAALIALTVAALASFWLAHQIGMFHRDGEQE